VEGGDKDRTNGGAGERVESGERVVRVVWVSRNSVEGASVEGASADSATLGMRTLHDEPAIIRALQTMLDATAADLQAKSSGGASAVPAVSVELVVYRSAEHTLASSIALFASAAVVVGVHGAALSNALFCRPGTALVSTNALYAALYTALVSTCNSTAPLVEGSLHASS
jgi:hypothetical protein